MEQLGKWQRIDNLVGKCVRVCVPCALGKGATRNQSRKPDFQMARCLLCLKDRATTPLILWNWPQ
jgi:hypothetical protein